MFKKLLLALVLAVASMSAFSTDYIFVHKDVTITARGNRACYPEVLAVLSPEAPKLEWRAADITVQGVPVKGCWAIYQGEVAVITERGGGGLLPQSEFRILREV